MFRSIKFLKGKQMEKKHELKKEYVQRIKPAGIFQIKNKVTGKIFLGSSLNLEGPLNRHKFELKVGSHKNQALLADWRKYGEENFSFDILATLELNDDPNYNYQEDLEILEHIWIEKVQPFGEQDYNVETRIRQA